MKKKQKDDRKRLLIALINYAEESGTFNPCFHKNEMLAILGVTEGQFNIMMSRLGPEYCRMLDIHEGQSRFTIFVDKCLQLRDQFKQSEINEKRHQQLIRIMIFCAILSAVVGYALVSWFAGR